MPSFLVKSHKPEVRIYRFKGACSDKDIAEWRRDFETLVEENKKAGAVGALIDVGDIDSVSVDALDSLIEILVDPEEIVGGIKARFAFIGIKPFARRFLNEVMPLEPLKQIRARSFHEVAEEEALAWLQAMIDSTDAQPDKQVASDKKEPEKTDTKLQAEDKPAATAPSKSAAASALERLVKRAEPDKK